MADDWDARGAAPGRRRRSWSLDEKRRIVDESLEMARHLPSRAASRSQRQPALHLAAAVRYRTRRPKELVPILPVTIAMETAAEENQSGIERSDWRSCSPMAIEAWCGRMSRRRL